MDSFLSRWRDGIIGVSERVCKDIMNRLNVDKEKCFVIYNGIDVDSFRNTVPAPGLRASLGLKDDDIVVVMVARLVAQKNHSMMLSAAAQVVEDKPNVKFLLVGDGKLRESLREEATSRRIGENVVFTGARDDVAQLLKVSDIGILPTLKEGFSNALVECMAAGLPMVVSNVGGNPEAVNDGYNGYVISPEDTDALASKIKLLSEDGSLRKRMSQESIKRVEKFSLTRMIDQTESLYYELLKS
jgi:glycosyltransferase involved in cell wall biosynthesis